MAQPGAEGGQDTAAAGSADDVVRPGTGVVRPGTGVVRPGTGVVRPGGATAEGTAKAVAAVPEAPEKPPEPIHVVLPVIPVKPAKQGFLDRLVAGKSDAEKAAEEAKREEEARRKAAEEQRRVEEKAQKEAEKARQAQEEAQRKAEERAQKEAEKARRERDEAEEKARAKAEDKALKEAEKVRRERDEAEEKARRAEERALRRAREDEDEEYEDEEYDLAGPATAPRPAPPAPAPPRAPAAPPRPPAAPPRPGVRPGPARPAPPPGRIARRPDGRPSRYEQADRYEPVRRPLWQWAVAVVVAVALGGGSAAVTGVVVGEGSVAYHAGIDMGQLAPILDPLDEDAQRPSRAGLDAALAPLFASPGLGPSVAGSVIDAETGELLWDRRGDAAMTPASTAKLLTAAAVLVSRGPNYRIPTRAVAGANPGEVVLVAGGDPTLAFNDVSAYRGAARLDDLAEQVRAALGSTTPTRVIIDTSIFSGPTVHPSWLGPDINGGIISSITALMTDGARVNPADTRQYPERHDSPDLAAGQGFAQALGMPASQIQLCSLNCAPAGARMLGEVFSPPMARIVEKMLLDSDNVVAEMLARQAALAKDLPGSFDGAAQATNEVLAEIGVPTPPGVSLVDGSGLSDDNRVTANQLTALLHAAVSPEHPELRALLSGLPVAGYSGSLGGRGGAGLGVVRAKTGTLAHVNALAGYAIDSDDRMLLFAVVADATADAWPAERALDQISAAISRCGCG